MHTYQNLIKRQKNFTTISDSVRKRFSETIELRAGAYQLYLLLKLVLLHVVTLKCSTSRAILL